MNIIEHKPKTKWNLSIPFINSSLTFIVSVKSNSTIPVVPFKALPPANPSKN
ncbi:hypothetical protein [Mesoplasma entomophilum]|uniref:hypothetical protein n=1 Tax=Mesoplasma entomophilum TaxID=2149 RepID=UPI0012FE1738|nr:hypothetical protein [Mesoplasma entomophilum]